MSKKRVPEWPNSDWTPKQKENYEKHTKETYEELETELGRTWFRRCYRPKKRNDGYMKRNHVKLGTPEDYIVTHVDDMFDPWGSFHGIMMREFSFFTESKEELKEAISDIIRAKLRVLARHNPEKAKRLLADTEHVASLYGVTPE